MRHLNDHRKLGRTTKHRKSLLRNLSESLIKSDRIQTTLCNAKEGKRFIEKLITKARKDTLAARRLVAKDIHDPDALKRLFSTIAPKFSTRPGGYTRIIKLNPRRGDNSQMALLEFVGNEKKEEEKPKRKKRIRLPGRKRVKKDEAAETPKAKSSKAVKPVPEESEKTPELPPPEGGEKG